MSSESKPVSCDGVVSIAVVRSKVSRIEGFCLLCMTCLVWLQAADKLMYHHQARGQCIRMCLCGQVQDVFKQLSGRAGCQHDPQQYFVPLISVSARILHRQKAGLFQKSGLPITIFCCIFFSLCTDGSGLWAPEEGQYVIIISKELKSLPAAQAVGQIFDKASASHSVNVVIDTRRMGDHASLGPSVSFWLSDVMDASLSSCPQLQVQSMPH